MKTRVLLLPILMVIGALSTGCADISPRDNVSPRLQQQIDNTNGKIERIESNQNAIRMAIENRSENHNSGVQILQGDSGLILIFGVCAILCLTYYFFQKSVKQEKVNQILADQIKTTQDPQLEENVLKAAQYTSVEKHVFGLFQ